MYEINQSACLSSFVTIVCGQSNCRSKFKLIFVFPIYVISCIAKIKSGDEMLFKLI